MGTPDRCEDIVVPTNGLIKVVFRALVKHTDLANAEVALFVGSNQAKLATASAAPAAQSTVQVAASDYEWVISYCNGITFLDGAPASDGVTTGLVAGSECVIQGLPAGTYDVSARYKVGGGGTLSAKNRGLWVRSEAYA